MFRPSRSRDREAVPLGWRLRIFTAAAVLALAGMWLDLRWPIWAAIAVLLLGLVVRFLPERHGVSEPPAVSGSEDEGKSLD